MNNRRNFIKSFFGICGLGTIIPTTCLSGKTKEVECEFILDPTGQDPRFPHDTPLRASFDLQGNVLGYYWKKSEVGDFEHVANERVLRYESTGTILENIYIRT